MKSLILASLVVLGLTSCGKEYVTTTQMVAQDFEGFYYCDNNSNIELVTDYNNSVIVESYGQSMNSVNPKNGTLGTHPTVSYRDLVINGNKLVIFPRNYNYSSSTHDIENDTTGSNITGNKRTDVLFQLNNDKSLKVEFTIYSNAVNSNINSVIAKRTFTCNR